MTNDFFNAPLSARDEEVFKSISREVDRQQHQVELIASENIVSRAVLEAQGSVLTNKYAEGYPKKRYYGGCEYVDETETLAIERAKKLFNCGFANVQPHSGAQANQAVFQALLQPGDTFLGMALDQGGHLTHGSKANQSGKWFNAISYGIKDDGQIDYAEAERLTKEHQPKLIIAGASAYPLEINFKKFREIADLVGAYLMVDMAHYAGLIAAGEYNSPFPHAHVATTTTHKTLRGPRGGMVLTDDADIAKKINSAVFPGLQGGPLEHVIAAKAVAFGEALQPEFKSYIKAVKENAKVMSDVLAAGGLDMVAGGTQSHMVLVDLRPIGVTGKAAENALDRAGLTCNKNAVPNDPESPFVTSGIRLGSPAGTSRGFRVEEFRTVSEAILKVLKGLAENGEDGNEAIETQVRREMKGLCDRFPIYEYISN